STCTLRTSCHTLHKGRYFKCSPSPFIPDWLCRLGIDSPEWFGDSVAVRDNPQLRAQLGAYLATEEPLKACEYCLGGVGKSTPSRKMNKAAARRWLAETDPDVHELVDRKALTASLSRRSLGIDLTGVLGTMRGLKLRWMIAFFLMRLLRLDITGLPPTM